MTQPNTNMIEEVERRPDAIHQVVSQESWMKQALCIVVVGASGDLAKKKTYPSLLALHQQKLLPNDLVIWGYARSKKTHEELRVHLYPHLIKTGCPEVVVHDFLSKCYYHSGTSYSDEDAHTTMAEHMSDFENRSHSATCNRLFYFAIPPNVFGETAIAIKRTSMATSGWTRVVVEKPFGRDLASCQELLATLSNQFDETSMYRMDHYLGKEVVQNILIWRFGNSWTHWLWNSNAVESVTLTFKEPFGTEGRGGYFDNYGIIRDILQNHLLQVLTLVAMEPPTSQEGDAIRDAKVNVLENIRPIDVEDDVLLGQYEGYADDPTITNKNTNCPTFAAIRCQVDTPRWQGVPFILQAGKALEERSCEVRIRLKPPTTTASIHRVAKHLGPNEIVMRLQPDAKLELVNNIKTPGLSEQPAKSSMELSYKNLASAADTAASSPDAYTRLLLDVLRGRQGAFVRDDELCRSWEIFTPLLHQIEAEHIQPFAYKYGSKGPPQLDAWLEKVGGCPSRSYHENLPSATAPIQASL